MNETGRKSQCRINYEANEAFVSGPSRKKYIGSEGIGRKVPIKAVLGKFDPALVLG